MNKKKILIIVGSAISTVILGAIGSGLWEKCFRKLFDQFSNAIVRFFSFISETYKAGIYTEAAQGLHEYYSLQLYAMYLVFIPFLYLLMVKRHPHNKEDASKDPIRDFMRSKKGYYGLWIMTFSVFIFFMLSLTKLSYINRLITASNQAITILSPHLDPTETLTLKAEFASMKSASNFRIFKEHADRLSEKFEVEIPEIKEM